jgi:ferric iron reductase protein FhuF
MMQKKILICFYFAPKSIKNKEKNTKKRIKTKINEKYLPVIQQVRYTIKRFNIF